MLDPNPQFTCDGCGTPKRETNHWFIAWTGAFRGLIVMAWEEDAAKSETTIHLCGQRCAHKALDHYLQHGTLDGLKPSRLV